MRKSNVPCVFYAREGYCSKGDYCTFLHLNKNISKPICKYFNTPAGCRHGKQCVYSHQAIDKPARQIISQPRILPPPNATKLPVNMDPSSQDKKNVINWGSMSRDNSKLLKEEVRNHNVTDMWNFSDQTSLNSDYFYGAPGLDLNDTVEKSYSDAVGNLFDNNYYQPSTYKQQDIKSKSIKCPFYIAGNCKYGSFCRNIHEVANEVIIEKLNDDTYNGIIIKEHVKMEEEVLEAKLSECGICLTPIGEGRTLGMLSHCSCIFCLECIRSWRQEGLSIARSDTVR